MRLVPFFILLAVQALFVFAAPLAKRDVDYYDPRLNNGSMLDIAGIKVGEPLNVIISGKSSPEVLTQDGLVNYARSIGFSNECLGLHIGTPQLANLGDGNGEVPQSIVLRQAYGFTALGTCWESLVGGNHFRVWHQNGPKANSGALFLAVSKEMDSIIHHHMIVENGYDKGRDAMVAAAVGKKTYGDYDYNTTVVDVPGLLKPGIKGINHNISIDGMVKLLTVTATKRST